MLKGMAVCMRGAFCAWPPCRNVWSRLGSKLYSGCGAKGGGARQLYHERRRTLEGRPSRQSHWGTRSARKRSLAADVTDTQSWTLSLSESL